MSTLQRKLAAVTVAVVSLSVAASAASAYDLGALHIERAWTRTPPTGAPTAEAFITVTNRGKTPDSLLGGASVVVKAIEPHTMSMTGGVMRMRLASGGFVIPPGGTLTLAPGGDHLMMVAPKRPLKAGDRIPATLRFAHAGAIHVEFVVSDTAPAR
jgi:copper(I)-binding protein